MKMNPQTNWAGFIDESSNRPDCSAVAGLAFRQLDIYIYFGLVWFGLERPSAKRADAWPKAASLPPSQGKVQCPPVGDQAGHRPEQRLGKKGERERGRGAAQTASPAQGRMHSRANSPGINQRAGRERGREAPRLVGHDLTPAWHP